MGSVVRWMERRQILLYIAAIVVGAVLGSAIPSIAPVLALSINPVLGLLLFATFLGMPLIEVGKGVRDVRFLGVILYTSDAADDLLCVDLGGRRIITNTNTTS